MSSWIRTAMRSPEPGARRPRAWLLRLGRTLFGQISLGLIVLETDGFRYPHPPCSTLPVWCCWQ